MDKDSTAAESRQPVSGRLPLAIALIVVAVLGVSYYMYVRGQRAYFSSRDLRLLEIVSDQLDEALRTNEGFVRNFGGSRDTPQSYVRGGRTELGTVDPATFLPQFDSAARDCRVATVEPVTRPAFTRSLDWDRSEPVLTIAYHEVATPLDPVPAPNGTSQESAGALAVLPQLQSVLTTDPCAGAERVIRDATGRISLREIVEPVFSQPLLSAFDDVMLVRGDGTVIFTEHQHARGALSRGQVESLQDHIVANLGALVEQTGWRDTKKLDLASVRDETRISEVQSSSGTYLLFTQPFTHDTVDHDSSLQKGDGRQWIVAGIVSKRRFMYEVLSVSTTGVLVVLALLVMMICAWPYLRASLIGAYQRITIADVLLLGTAALVHAAVLTLVVADVIAYRSLRNVSDQQLKLLGDRLESDLYADLASGARTLDKLDEWGRTLPPEGWTQDAISDVKLNLENPYVSTVAWIDEEGRQRFKASMRTVTPLVNVAHRRYFQDAKANKLQQLDGAPSVAIDSIRSSTTGETEVILSKRSPAAGLPVVAATVQLVHVRHAVLPPGFGFAMIDESGKVIFHSDESRNNQENFFAETDWDRTVRSAVYAHHERTASVRYWGQDHRVYVRPLKLPWTLIVFRNKSLLRTVNTEAVAMTLSMLLGNAAAYLLILLLLLLWKPRYRAPHVWPVARNRHLYLRLIVLYAITFVSAALAFYAFDARTVLQITLLIPAQAFAATVIVLEERRQTSKRWIAAVAVWALFTVTWVLMILLSDTMPGTGVANLWWLVAIAALLLLAAQAWATFSRKNYEVNVPYSRVYIAAGVLFLGIGAVLPAFGLFKVASRLEIEGLVKHSQLFIADQAEKSIAAIESANTSDKPVAAYGDVWERDPFGTTWQRVPAAAPAPNTTGFKRDEAWLPDVYRDVLPAYSEESVSLRQLHGASTTHGPWQWWWKNDLLLLDKASSSREHVRVQMKVPLSFAEAWYLSGGFSSRVSVGAILLALAIAAVIAILVMIVRFFATKLFLIDIHVPLWFTPPPPLRPTLGDHVFLIHSAKSVDQLTAGRDGLDFTDVKFETLADRNAKPGAWDEKLLEIDRAAEGQNVRIVDFEYGATDAGLSMKKLMFLERLLGLPNRTVIIASTITPAAFLAMITNDDLRKRWSKVLGSFVWATESQLEPPAVEDETTAPRNNKEWLERETGHDGFLRELRAELAPTANDTDRQALIDELLERANTHYAGLWASCSPSEKILLHQLAREGLINGKDRKSVRRLLARGLVRRRPHLCLFNDTFRSYVIDAAKRDAVPVDTQQAPSAWDAIKVPIFVVFVSVVIMILATQKDLLNMTTGLVAALTTGLPAIVRLFGFLTERRLNSAEKS